MSLVDAWARMEAMATEMTQKRNEENRKIEKKLEAIRRFNREHPITTAEPVTVYQYEQSDDEIARESARWIGAYHAKLLGGFGITNKK